MMMYSRGEFSEDEQKAFESENAGITVEFVDSMDITRFYAMYAAGSPPDLMRVQAPSIPKFLARKLLFDLTPYFQASQLLKMDDLMPANDYYKAGSAAFDWQREQHLRHGQKFLARFHHLYL
ncbi:MAG: extracellular solute-binding protein [Desulfobacterales bacterium]|nr:extracellular solute-binding protein [Desulfobacterales bacterium]